MKTFRANVGWWGGLFLVSLGLGLGGATTTTAATIPDTLGWYEIPNTNLKSVFTPNDFGGSSYPFFDQRQYLVDSWNSGALDTTRNRLLLWGGGHVGYAGNEIYAIDLNTLTPQRLNDPGLPVADGSTCVESIVNGTQPNARHTYDALVYMPNVDRLFIYAGALFCSGGYTSPATWTFSGRYYGFAYGPLPATFSPTPQTTPSHWSFCRRSCGSSWGCHDAVC